jgi:hypothetical protein
MLEGRYGHASTLLPDGTVLVTGGYTRLSGVEPSASAELYDPDTDRWMRAATMSGIRSGHTATLLEDGTVLVAGGGTYNGGNGSPVDTAEIYDTTAGDWTAVASMHDARADHTATVLGDGTLLVTGGVGTDTQEVVPMNTTLATAERYDPKAGKWTAIAKLDEGRAGHTAELLSDGRVLVTGLWEAEVVDVYDPATGTWGAIPIPEGLSIGSIVPLRDGTLLAIGNVMQVLDPRSGAWTAVAGMIRPRSGWTATVLADGVILVAGGVDRDAVRVAPAELFDVASAFDPDRPATT